MKGILIDFIFKEFRFWVLGFFLLGYWGYKNKKRRRKKKRKFCVEVGEVERTFFRLSLELYLREGF